MIKTRAVALTIRIVAEARCCRGPIVRHSHPVRQVNSNNLARFL